MIKAHILNRKRRKSKRGTQRVKKYDKLLELSMTKLGLSARAYDRLLKVARTIADIEGSEQITKTHLLESLSYRALDRNSWLG